jgi:hypothetical protein
LYQASAKPGSIPVASRRYSFASPWRPCLAAVVEAERAHGSVDQGDASPVKPLGLGDVAGFVGQLRRLEHLVDGRGSGLRHRQAQLAGKIRHFVPPAQADGAIRAADQCRRPLPLCLIGCKEPAGDLRQRHPFAKQPRGRARDAEATKRETAVLALENVENDKQGENLPIEPAHLRQLIEGDAGVSPASGGSNRRRRKSARSEQTAPTRSAAAILPLSRSPVTRAHRRRSPRSPARSGLAASPLRSATQRAASRRGGAAAGRGRPRPARSIMPDYAAD